MSKHDKICPIMTAAPHSDPDGVIFAPVYCQKNQCQLWIEVFTTELVRVQGCAHALAPQMVDGQLRV